MYNNINSLGRFTSLNRDIFTIMRLLIKEYEMLFVKLKIYLLNFPPHTQNNAKNTTISHAQIMTEVLLQDCPFNLLMVTGRHIDHSLLKKNLTCL